MQAHTVVVILRCSIVTRSRGTGRCDVAPKELDSQRQAQEAETPTGETAEKSTKQNTQKVPFHSALTTRKTSAVPLQYLGSISYVFLGIPVVLILLPRHGQHRATPRAAVPRPS